MQAFRMDMTHQLVLLVLQLIVAGVLLWIHRLLPVIRRWMQHHLTMKERMMLQHLGHEAFIFAETAYKDFDGPGKLNQALYYASAVAKRQGLNVTSAELRAAIEQGWWDAGRIEHGRKEKQP